MVYSITENGSQSTKTIWESLADLWRKGTGVFLCSLWEKKVSLHVKAWRLHSGWAGLLPTRDLTLQSKGSAEKYSSTLTTCCSHSGLKEIERRWKRLKELKGLKEMMDFMDGLPYWLLGKELPWHCKVMGYGTKLLLVSRSSQQNVCVGVWVGKRRETSTSQRCSDIRTESTWKVSLSSVASKSAWEIGIQERVCICAPPVWIEAWLLWELY